MPTALGLYGICFLITGAVHIRLNNALENPGSPAAIHDLAGVVDAFEGPWVAWHAVRTIALVESSPRSSAQSSSTAATARQHNALVDPDPDRIEIRTPGCPPPTNSTESARSGYRR